MARCVFQDDANLKICAMLGATFGKDSWECFLASSHASFAVIHVPGNQCYFRKLDQSHIIKKLHFQVSGLYYYYGHMLWSLYPTLMKPASNKAHNSS